MPAKSGKHWTRIQDMNLLELNRQLEVALHAPFAILQELAVCFGRSVGSIRSRLYAVRRREMGRRVQS